MKKSFILLAFVMGTLAANAQEVVQGTKLSDNWSLGVNVGATTPFKHSSYLNNARPAFGLELSKQLTPIFGLGLQGMGYVNTSSSKTMIDASELSLLAKVNLMNLFSGYKGTPRFFEIETVLGTGWMHHFQSGLSDDNVWSNRVGLNFNFNLGESKAWTVAVKPALVYNMEKETKGNQFNANKANFELTAGLTYHFKTSNGTHSFVKIKPYNQAEIDDLNASVNSLRGQLNSKDSELNSANQRNRTLQKELDDYRNKPAQVVNDCKSVESIVVFRQGKSAVDATQLPNVDRIASYLNENSNAKVVIKGYASPEGGAKLNSKLSKARAEAVKKILVKKYKINESRISTEGLGVGNIFSTAAYNRISICTVEE